MPTAQARRVTPIAPAANARAATAATTPPIRTALSALPKVSMAHSFTGLGAASTARLATAKSGEVTPESSAVAASAEATAATAAKRPATPPRRRWATVTCGEERICGIPVVRRSAASGRVVP